MATPILEFANITKSFPGVLALDNVSFSVYKGEVHALVGENGAGKTTLVNVMAGIHRPDSGQVLFEGRPVQLGSPKDSLNLGIAFIHQELAMVPALSVAENVFLGRLPYNSKRMRVVDWDKLHKLTEEVLQRIGLEIDPEIPVGYLSMGQRQQIEIGRALAWNPKVLVMDEPTSALTEHEVERLFQTIEKLSAEGITVIFISHRLGEVRQIAHRLTVLRDGRVILTKGVGEVTWQELAEAMLGHTLEVRTTVQSGVYEPVLTVRNLSSARRFENITIQVCKGEILGIAGLLGAGKTELLRAIYGLDPIDAGEICIEGRPVFIDSPQTAIRHGVFLVPEDRKLEGLVMCMSVADNITLPYLAQLSNMGFVSRRERSSVVNAFIQRLKIKTPSIEQKVRLLSGGNQQKVILARLLSMKPRILLMDQPTRGLDIGAKEEIYQLMYKLAGTGLAIVFVATEMAELLRVCNRIYVMREGRIVDEFDTSTCSEQDLFLSSVGGTD